METTQEQLFYDPFAEGDEFNPAEAYEEIYARYANNEVEHDYTADEFVRDAEALMMDAEFVGRYEDAQLIAAQMHALCGEDHALQELVAQSELLSQHNADDGHHHEAEVVEHDHKPEDAKKKKKKKSMWDIVLESINRNSV